MKNLLFLICAISVTLLSADFAEAGGGGGGKSSSKVRLRNNSGSQPVRVWLLTSAQAASIPANATKADLNNLFGGGVNLNGNKHKDFNVAVDNYVAVVFHTAAFDPLPSDATPLTIPNLGFYVVPVAVASGTRQRVDFQATIDNMGVRSSDHDGPTPY